MSILGPFLSNNFDQIGKYIILNYSNTMSGKHSLENFKQDSVFKILIELFPIKVQENIKKEKETSFFSLTK